jgi:CBS domain-containing protein
MTAGKICVRDVVTAAPHTTVLDAALLMRRQHVGDLVVIDEKSGKKFPIGIVTDRDIVIGVVAMGLETKVFTLGDMVLTKVITCREDDDLDTCLQTMRSNGIRRLPVTSRDGQLVGILTIDDLIQSAAKELASIAQLIGREQSREARTRV